MTYERQAMESPVGTLVLVGQGAYLHAVVFETTWPLFQKRFADAADIETPVLKETKRQLKAYFAGKRREFDLPLKLSGTDFQNRVWAALSRIPFGKTSTYRDQAILVKSPKAVRAVGQTNGKNPLCIILPCHRVIGSNGAMTGYAGGLKTKEFLLKLEGALLT